MDSCLLATSPECSAVLDTSWQTPVALICIFLSAVRFHQEMDHPRLYGREGRALNSRKETLCRSSSGRNDEAMMPWKLWLAVGRHYYYSSPLERYGCHYPLQIG